MLEATPRQAPGPLIASKSVNFFLALWMDFVKLNMMVGGPLGKERRKGLDILLLLDYYQRNLIYLIMHSYQTTLQWEVNRCPG